MSAPAIGWAISFMSLVLCQGLPNIFPNVPLFPSAPDSYGPSQDIVIFYNTQENPVNILFRQSTLHLKDLCYLSLFNNSISGPGFSSRS
jgi:hypothetical protein